jgi:hypothetical protein
LFFGDNEDLKREWMALLNVPVLLSRATDLVNKRGNFRKHAGLVFSLRGDARSFAKSDKEFTKILQG